MKINDLPPMARSIIELLSGNVLAQVILVAFALWLPRLYGPAAFGDFALFMAVFNIFTPLAAGRYEMTLVLPESDGKARTLLSLSVLLVMGSFALLLALSPLFPAFIASWPRWLLAYTLIACLLGALLYLAQQYLVRLDAFRTLSTSKVLLAAGASLSQLLAFYTLPAYGLIAGYGIGILASLAFLVHARPAILVGRWEGPALRTAAREYFPVVRYSWPAAALNVVTSNIQPVLLTALFGLTEAGYFFLAYRLLGLPLNALSSAVSSVFYREVVIRLRASSGQACRLTGKVVGIMAGLTLLGFVLFYLAGGALFSWFFGEAWEPAFAYALLLMPFFLGKSLANSISTLAEALGKTRAEFFFSLALLITLLAAALFGKAHDRVEVFLYIYSFGSAAAYLLLVTFLIRYVREADRIPPENT